jgi:hypothetical protein
MAASQTSAEAELHKTSGIQRAAPTTSTAREKLNDAGQSGKEKAAEVRAARIKAKQMADQGHSRKEIESELNQSLSLQGAVITVIVAGATAYAGLNVMSSINDTMALTSGEAFYNSSQSLQQGISDFFTNLPTVFVVIALVLIIGYLTLLR